MSLISSEPEQMKKVSLTRPQIAFPGFEAIELLTQAAKENSGNEELAQEAFIQMIRMNETAKAQQVRSRCSSFSVTIMSLLIRIRYSQLSLRMTANFSTNPDYALWSIMTVILQIRDLQHPQSDLLLSLAERQASKYFESSTEYKTSDEFHIVSRLLELRAQLASSQPTPSSSATPKFPSLPSSETPRTPSTALLDHFASTQGDMWCKSNLGFELWRRETELRFGSTEGGEWKRSWNRLKATLESGFVYGLFSLLL